MVSVPANFPLGLVFKMDYEYDNTSYASAPLVPADLSQQIRDMTWSYSRISTYEMCPYQWYLHYILKLSETSESFYTEYGSMVHDLIADCYTGKKTPDEVFPEYAGKFAKLPMHRVSDTVRTNYFNGGLAYLENFKIPDEEIVSVEHKIHGLIDGIKFVGRIDLITKDKDGGLIINDHKSKALKPYSNRKKRTNADAELDKYLRQLYLYAELLKCECGEYPSKLRINSFRVGNLIEVPFDEKRCHEVMAELENTIDSIATNSDFIATPEYFKCWCLCGFNHVCEYEFQFDD